MAKRRKHTKQKDAFCWLFLFFLLTEIGLLLAGAWPFALMIGSFGIIGAGIYINIDEQNKKSVKSGRTPREAKRRVFGVVLLIPALLCSSYLYYGGDLRRFARALLPIMSLLLIVIAFSAYLPRIRLIINALVPDIHDFRKALEPGEIFRIWGRIILLVIGIGISVSVVLLWFLFSIVIIFVI